MMTNKKNMRNYKKNTMAMIKYKMKERKKKRLKDSAIHIPNIYWNKKPKNSRTKMKVKMKTKEKKRNKNEKIKRRINQNRIRYPKIRKKSMKLVNCQQKHPIK